MIELKQVCKVYQHASNTTYATNQVDLAICKDEFVMLVGPSGSGKTSLLNIMGAIDHPTSGQVYFEGLALDFADGAALSKYRLDNVGFVFQDFNLVQAMTAQENVYLPLLAQNHRYSMAQLLQKSNHFLSLVGLEDKKNNRVTELSGGQKQRVAIARALIKSPKIVFADEPTANLDKATTTEIIRLILSLKQQFNMTFVFATHDHRILPYANKLIYVEDGKIIKQELVS
jgi:putative ABC transport system ATP-binding protein